MIRIDKVEEVWKALSDLMEISILDNDFPGTELDRELEDSENKFLYLKLIAEKAKKNRVRPAGSTDNLEQVFANEPMQVNESKRRSEDYSNFIRILKIELPTFFGLYEEWYTF